MGQKVRGYRRNTYYGVNINELIHIDETSGEKQVKPLFSHSWIYKVNPKGMLGWNLGGTGITKSTYGINLNESRRLLLSIEEVRIQYGCTSNGLGRTGTKETGYTVYGEYTKSIKSTLNVHVNYTNLGNIGSEVSQKEESKKTPRLRDKLPFKDQINIEVAIERVAVNFEKNRKSKISRKRMCLKDIREEYNRVKEKEELMASISSTISYAEELSESIVLSGILPTVNRTVKLIARELRGELNHIKTLRSREMAISQHALTSPNGRKGVGMSYGRSGKKVYDGGYYGYNLTLKGPLDGARRTMSHVIKIGKVPLGTKRAMRVSSHEHAKTTVGTIGIRGSYCYGRG